MSEEEFPFTDRSTEPEPTMDSVEEARAALHLAVGRLITGSRGTASVEAERAAVMTTADAYALAVHVKACEQRQEVVYDSANSDYGPYCGDGWYCDDAPTGGKS